MWAYCDELEYLGVYAFNKAPQMLLPENHLVMFASLQGAVAIFSFQNCNGPESIAFVGNGVTVGDGAAVESVDTL